MRTAMIGALGVAALLLGGCETLNGPQAVANAEAQRHTCSGVTVVTNTNQSMRMQNKPGVETDNMRQAEGQLALNRFKLHTPPAIQDDHPNEETLVAKAQRDC